MMVNRVTRVGDGGGGVVDGGEGEVTLWSRGWGGGEVSTYILVHKYNNVIYMRSHIDYSIICNLCGKLISF